MALKAHEHDLKKIFSQEFDFEIPHYQRPYAWGTEQTLQLLDDLTDAVGRDGDEPYFLGSLVLVKPQDDKPAAQVIDGQQRLTTLSILFAVLRDLTDDEHTRAALSGMVLEAGVPIDNIPSKPRLLLRQQDAAFFTTYVQTVGRIEDLRALTDQALKTDAQKGIRDNAKALHARLREWDESRRAALVQVARLRTFLVVVGTPDIASAHRIFSVMNARGLDLTPADIFKSSVIGDLPEADHQAYATKWETEEQNLGRRDFADLFLHLRAIHAKVRGQRELLVEFPKQVLVHYAGHSGARTFVDDVLVPYATAYEHLLRQDYNPQDPAWARVNAWLKRLIQLDNNDWRPPALWALRNHPDDPVFLDEFLRRLERLAASMLLRRVYATPRALRYVELLKQLDEGAGLEAKAFDLDDEEKGETRAKLDAEIYTVVPVRKYVLLRLDELLANQPGVAYDHKIITVEHVLPQNPKAGSQWMSTFSQADRGLWTNRLGNLLLLNRQKNSQAQNYEFAKKKEKYFTTDVGVAAFALTTQVLGHDAWTPRVVASRHDALVERLVDEWELA